MTSIRNYMAAIFSGSSWNHAIIMRVGGEGGTAFGHMRFYCQNVALQVKIRD